MIEQINETEWEKAFGYKYHSLFFDPKYLNIVKEAFNYQLHYYTCRRHNKIVFAAALFSKNGKVVIPYAFTYNSIYIDNTIGDIVYVQILEDFLALLRSRFKKIALRLPPTIVDVRPFIWADFKIVNRYTYCKDIYSPIKTKVFKNIRKVEEDGVCFVEEDVNNENLELNLETCFKYGLPKSLYGKYRTLFTLLSTDNYLKTFALYKNGKMIATRIVMIDSVLKTLYTFSYNDLNNKSLVSYFNMATFNWCADNSIERVDMVGANEKGIANFKYSFNAVLTPYFWVDYSSKEASLKHLIEKVKGNIKKALRL